MACILGMLQNFVQLIQAFGHIPNGNRIYYTRRTQPPLFISMVDAYYEVCAAFSFCGQKVLPDVLFFKNIGNKEQKFHPRKYSVHGTRIRLLDGKKNR